MKQAFAVMLAALLAGCLTARPPAAQLPAALAAAGSLLSLERDSCFGACPAYRLDVDTDGAVRYQGRANVCTDRASDRLSPGKLAELRAAIARSKFASTPEHCCDCPVSDSPTIILTVADPPPAKTIVDSADRCEGAPTTVRDLAQAIDVTVGIERWIGTAQEREQCHW